MKSLSVFIVATILFLGVSLASSNPQDASNLSTSRESTEVRSAVPHEDTRSTCDGTTVTADCTLDGVDYITYVYHPAVAEVSHTETVTTYSQKVSGYCTLCRDGTYSPSCATGRGACSHHGGVAQWNAPRYTTVPEYSTRIVVDTPAQEAYYEKVVEE